MKNYFNYVFRITSMYSSQYCLDDDLAVLPTTGQSAQSAKTRQSPTEFVLKLHEKEKFCAVIYKF